MDLIYKGFWFGGKGKEEGFCVFAWVVREETGGE